MMPPSHTFLFMDMDTDTFLSMEENNEDQPLLKKQRLLDVEDLDTELHL
jgi:hypothetical protein